MDLKLKKAKIDHLGKKVNLEFEGGYFFPVSLDDYSHLSQIFDPVSSSLHFLLLNYALYLLSLSPQSTKNLNLKLKKHYFILLHRYRYPFKPLLEPILESINQKINSLALNSRDSFIDYFIAKNSQKSARHIIFLLHQNGLGQEDIAPYLDNLYQSDTAKIENYLKKHSRLDPSKAFSRLVNKGFRQDTVKTLIDAILKNS